MRGKGSFVLLLGELIRITPACAGKRSLLPLLRCCLLDHPRMCGEKVAFDRNLPHTRGSPPHVRGKDDEGRLKLRHVGITPAYAGKRCARRQRSVGAWDHPRVCGEKYPCVCQDLERVGITPAYAGKRPCLTCVLATLWDHPRVCGEKTSSPAALALR